MGQEIPVAWPHDGANRQHGESQSLSQLYKNAGANMLPNRATFEDGGSSVEAGIQDILDRMQSGRFKVFDHLTEWLEEFRLYHRKNGLIVKQNDDLLDATRYGVMMVRFAKVVRADGRIKRRKARIIELDYDLFE